MVEAQSPSESSPSKVVTGKVSQVEGEFHMAKDRQGDDTLDIVDKSYVITSQAGEEVRLELDDNTKVRKRVNLGDKIVAKISSKGHTLSVTRLEP
jgi:methyl coenzyme M reductase beta subunit